MARKYRDDRNEKGSEEDNGRAERERGKQDRKISDRYESGRGRRRLEGERTRDDERERRRRPEREDGDEGEHRKREVEDKRRGRGKEWHSRRDLEEEDYRNEEEEDYRNEKRKRPDRRSDREGDDHYVKDKRRRAERDDGDGKKRKEKEGISGPEDSRSLREEEEGDGKMNADLKLQKQPALQRRMLNAEPANLGRSGGAYMPPFKLARMMKEVEDKSSVEYQRLTWDALRKSINGLVNKVNATNIRNIIPELFAENLTRGMGLFCRSCMKSQMASPGFTDVFAALVAVVNTKFPDVGKLLLRRIILQLKRAYKRNDKVWIFSPLFVVVLALNILVANSYGA